MIATFLKLLRGIAAALLLGFWTAPTAEAAWWSRSQSSARSTHEASAARGDPARGVIMIAGGVALLVFLAWVAVRIGEADRPADKVPN